MKKRIINLLIVTAMLLGLMLGMTVTASAYTHQNHCYCGVESNCTTHNVASIEWKAWTSTDSLPTTSGYYYLANDVTLKQQNSKGSSTAYELYRQKNTIAAGQKVYLCLNGHVITTEVSTLNLIYIKDGYESSGELILTDCGYTEHYFTYHRYGKWTLKNDATYAEKCYALNADNLPAPEKIKEGQLIKVEGGCLTGGGGDNGGYSSNSSQGGAIYNSGKLTVYGGNIIGNSANEGGAIYNNGKFCKLYGGRIMGNKATNSKEYDYGGGAVYNSISGLTVTGSTYIGHNTSENYPGGGIINIGKNSTLTVGGTAVIKDNTYKNGSSCTPNNIYLKDSTNTIYVDSLMPGAFIGVSTSKNPTLSADVAISRESSEDVSSYFSSDNETYKIINKYSGTNNIVMLTAGHTHCTCGNRNCTESGHKDISWTAWTSNNSLPSTKGYYYLTENVVIDETWQPADGTVLCLNGHVIKKEDSEYESYQYEYSVINVNYGCTFTLIDCDNDTTHYYKVCSDGHWEWNDNIDDTDKKNAVSFESLTARPETDTIIALSGGALTNGIGHLTSGEYSGGGVYCSGTFNLLGGNIVGNTAKYGGGVYVYGSNCLFNQTGGNIVGNSASSSSGLPCGGGVNINSKGKATISGGSVSYNSSGNMAGGVYAYGNLLVSGGKITGNYAKTDGGGILFSSSEGSAVILGGTATVTGNTVNGKASNLNLQSGQTVSLGTMTEDNTGNNVAVPVTSGADAMTIGVTTQTTPSDGSPVNITGNNSQDFSSCFTSDNSTYSVYNSGSGDEQVLVLSSHRHQWNYEVSTTTTTDDTIKASCSGNTDTNCEYYGKTPAYSVTIVGPTAADSVYDGSFKAASLTGKVLGDFILDEKDISYKGSENTIYPACNIAPLNAGTYTASISIDCGSGVLKTANVKYTISKADPEATDFTFKAPSDLAFDGNSKAAYVESDKVGMGNVTLTYYDKDGSPVSSPSALGTYTVKISVSEGTNYKSAENLTDGSWTFTISKKNQSILSPECKSRTHNSITLDAVSEGYGSTLYGLSLTDDSSTVTDWQSGTEFTGLDSETDYYFFAKYSGNDYYNEVVSSGTEISTTAKESDEDSEDTDEDSDEDSSDDRSLDPVRFIDISEIDYFYSAVKWAIKNKITSGINLLQFCPQASCTRAQMVTFLWRAAGSPDLIIIKNPFIDVDTSDYYYTAVLWAVQKGIVKGTSSITFSPEDVVKRCQAVTFLARMNGVKDSDTGYSHSFLDVGRSEYYSNAVAWAEENGITAGTSQTLFSPYADCLRCQIVTFLYRCFG